MYDYMRPVIVMSNGTNGNFDNIFCKIGKIYVAIKGAKIAYKLYKNYMDEQMEKEDKEEVKPSCPPDCSYCH